MLENVRCWWQELGSKEMGGGGLLCMGGRSQHSKGAHAPQTDTQV